MTLLRDSASPTLTFRDLPDWESARYGLVQGEPAQRYDALEALNLLNANEDAAYYLLVPVVASGYREQGAFSCSLTWMADGQYMVWWLFEEDAPGNESVVVVADDGSLLLADTSVNALDRLGVSYADDMNVSSTALCDPDAINERWYFPELIDSYLPEDRLQLAAVMNSAIATLNSHNVGQALYDAALLYTEEDDEAWCEVRVIDSKEYTQTAAGNTPVYSDVLVRMTLPHEDAATIEVLVTDDQISDITSYDGEASLPPTRDDLLAPAHCRITDGQITVRGWPTDYVADSDTSPPAATVDAVTQETVAQSTGAAVGGDSDPGFDTPDNAEEPIAEVEYFQTPSGNIFCTATSTYVRCDILSGLVDLPAKPSDCEWDWGAGLEVGVTAGAYVVCASDSAIHPDAPILNYGSTWTSGGLDCYVERGGLTCGNDDGHGFFLSRESWEAF